MGDIDKLYMLKKILKEAERIVAWQEDIYTDLNVHKGNPSAHHARYTDAEAQAQAAALIAIHAALADVHHARYTDAEVQAIIAAKQKVGSVTDTTTAAGLISVSFPEAFASTPVVIVQIKNDVDYYPVMISESTTGFTVKILKTAHIHSNPNTSAISAGTPSGTIGAEAAHTHGINISSGAPSAYRNDVMFGITEPTVKYCASVSGGSPTTIFQAFGDYTGLAKMPTHTHVHIVSGTSGAGSSHSHTFSGSALGTHSHTIADTDSANAGNLLANTEVTFSYIAMLP